MDFYESDLEDIIFNALKTKEGCDKLTELGIESVVTTGDKPIRVFRQLRIGNYGIADLVTVEKYHFTDGPRIHVKVYELKKDKLDENALIQVARYCTGISHYLKKRGIKSVVEPVLIGRTISDSNWLYLMDWTFIQQIYTYSYELTGMQFKKETFGYKLIEPNFK